MVGGSDHGWIFFPKILIFPCRKSLSLPGSISSKLPLKSLSFPSSGQCFSKSLSFLTSGQCFFKSLSFPTGEQWVTNLINMDVYTSRKSLSFPMESLSIPRGVLTNKGRLYTHGSDGRLSPTCSLQADPWSEWPPWVDTVTGLSHLTLTVSCSPTFYIYYALYGTRNKEGNPVQTSFALCLFLTLFLQGPDPSLLHFTLHKYIDILGIKIQLAKYFERRYNGGKYDRRREHVE